MPQHPADVQQLIAAIARTLDGAAHVTEWLLLRTAGGLPREVDVAIESTVAGRPVRIAVEYRDHARPADATWIEELAAKYRDLAVDQVVAVAKAGFTPAARTRAARHNMRTLTRAQAIRKDWAWAVSRVVGTIGGVDDATRASVPS